MKLFRKNSNLCDHNQPTSQTDGRTDRQTTCDRKTALCAKVHRAVKMHINADFVQLIIDLPLRWSVVFRQPRILLTIPALHAHTGWAPIGLKLGLRLVLHCYFTNNLIGLFNYVFVLVGCRWLWQAKLTFIHNCRYRQFELLISTIRIVDISNSNYGYQQLLIFIIRIADIYNSNCWYCSRNRPSSPPSLSSSESFNLTPLAFFPP